jgi:hypothetical protein
LLIVLTVTRALFHQCAHVRPRRAGEAARAQKGVARHERLHADRPQSTLRIKIYIALLL